MSRLDTQENENVPTTVPPSIFNDVLGPVMRGPSSSHSAAGNRIGRLARDLAGGTPRRVLVEYDPNGSLVTTHASQGSDLGLGGGLLGWEPDDPRVMEYQRHLRNAGIAVEVKYVAYGATHPNMYRLTVEGAGGKRHRMTAISTGGGAIEVLRIDGCAVSLAGDFFEVLAYLKPGAAAEPVMHATNSVGSCEAVGHCPGEEPFIRLSLRTEPDESRLATLRSNVGVREVRVLRPVLPVLSRCDLSVPFLTEAAMREWNGSRNLAFWELAAEYEAARGGISRDEVLEKSRSILKVMEAAVRTGLTGTEYTDRILPCQSTRYVAEEKAGRLIPGDAINRITAYVSAVMEVKSSLGVIVAAPTAGACGVLPGALIATAELLDSSETRRAQELLSAGLIGALIAARATFSAEVGGCMAECGSGSGMAAAALTGLAGGNLDQQLAAASLALQNTFGMVCDPIGNRVEAPCLGKNVMGAVNALACANMALAGYQHLIPLDEVIETMDRVGKSIPRELRCTALGGLSVTPSAKKIEASLKK
jgi:L-serine dehydratase